MPPNWLPLTAARTITGRLRPSFEDTDWMESQTQRKERLVAAIKDGNLEELVSACEMNADELAMFAAAAMVANAVKENTAAVKEAGKRQ